MFNATCLTFLFKNFVFKTKEITIFFLVVFPVFAFSQNTIQLSGHVLNKHYRPLENVKISLINLDSTLITTTYTDKTGLYKLTAVSVNTILLKAEIKGFETEVKAVQSNTLIDFMLFEADAINLQEVSIVAKNPIVEYKADKTVFNVENSVAATGGDAMDAIKRAPGVLVSRNEITVAGKNSVAVMINGRLQQLSGDDLTQMLRSIPAANISKIEVITSPSSKYDAEGNAGIINIILKKNTVKGFNGNVTLSHEYNTTLNFPTASTTFNYKRNKLNLFCNANGGVQGYNYSAYTDSYYPDQSWHQDVKFPYINSYSRLQLGGDYALTKKSTIGFMINGAMSWLNNNERIIAIGYDTDHQLDSTFGTTGKTTDKYPGKITANLNYEYRFDSTGKKVNVDVDYYRQEGNKNRTFTVYSENSTSLLALQTTNRTTGLPVTEIKSLKADFEMPFNIAKLNFGVKASDSQNQLNNLFETKTNEGYVKDTTRSTEFSYNEQIQAVYLNASKTWKKFEFSAGLRAEHTHGVGFSKTLVQTKTYDYTKLFPSGTIQYALNKEHVFSISVARRINRPNYSFLNPFRFYYTPNTFVQGNTGLQPAFNYITTLNYTYKSNLNVRLMHNTITNYFERVYLVDTVQQTNTVSRGNLGSKQVIAAFISGSIEPTKWWELTGSINGGFVKFQPFKAQGTRNYEGFNWWTEMTSVFYLNKKRTLNLEFTGYYYSDRQRDIVYWAAMSCVNVGIKYSLLNKKLILSFYGEDIFAKSYWLQTNRENNTVEYSYDGHPYRISVTFKFGNKNFKLKQSKGLEEIQRVN